MDLQKLEKELEGAGMSRSDVAKVFNRHASAITTLFNGKRKLTLDEAVKLSNILRKPIDAFLTGSNVKKFPIVGRSSGGPLTETIEYVDDGREVIYHNTDKTTIAGLYIDGDSMDRAGLFDGSVAIVDYSQTIPENLNGKIVVAIVGGQTTVKRLKLGPPLRLEPESTNPKHEPIYPDGDRNWYIWGVVEKVTHDV